ncbi:MAG: 30S ribosomal protein S17 [Planctomycetes bacterium]|nr:30S ribosomal protein S17 [Planctomycetota bacterium]MCW8136481.1 30S ribosomal protein S17 [Planctomycetota bacterium]
MTQAATTEKTQRGNRRKLQGVVVSSKMHKTITVLWERQVMHPRVHKIVKRKTKLHAHDENNEAKVGDLVEIQATRPISKTKTWRLVRVVRQATGVQAGE